MKRCWRCGESLPLDEFYKDSRRNDGRQTACKDCAKAMVKARYDANPKHHRARSRRYRQDNLEAVRERQRNRHYEKSYGITKAERDERIVELDSRCELCGKESPLVVDHCHETGRVRGMLCNPCNTAIGLLDEDLVRIGRLTDYLSHGVLTLTDA